MASLGTLSAAGKALRELGPAPLVLNALYRLGLKSGWYRYSGRPGLAGEPVSGPVSLFDLPLRKDLLQTTGEGGLQALLAEADEIEAGRVRLFGAEPVEIRLGFSQPLAHWTEYETNPDLLSSLAVPNNDVKFIWEPARFGFAFTIGRAYHLTGEEKYPAAFWRYFETFAAANPAYLGPNWMSGQEVALRLMAVAWAAQVFAASPHSTPARLAALGSSLAAHAARIPPTLVYARSQNNNHLLSEAAGLYTASLALPDHPQAAKWRKLGVKWLNWCFENQIDETGEYVQHSTNYQRLMLEIALWVDGLGRGPGGWESAAASPKSGRGGAARDVPSGRARQNLARATQWLLALTDPDEGHVANLGANDGARILPLSSLPFEHFRPTLQAASLAFCGKPAFQPGPWDETALWLPDVPEQAEPGASKDAPVLSVLHSPGSWAYLRAVRFASRPSHADQLHLDLWWQGSNIALDPGTYLYNAPPPWNNALAAAHIHNTVTVDGLDQMTRAGKFLYLDWAQARILEQDADHISAEHDGYRRLGIVHRRTVTGLSGGWRVRDELIVDGSSARTYRLHWLLPDWEWGLRQAAGDLELNLTSAQGPVRLALSARPSGLPGGVTLVRAGEYLHGSGPAELTRGWASPTYGVKIPALSLAVEVDSMEGVTFMSEFTFPATH